MPTPAPTRRRGRAARTRGAAGVVAAWLVALLLVPTPAAAVETDTFRLEPSPLVVHGHERRTFGYDLEPGDATTDAVRVTNRTDEERRFRLYGADAATDPATGAVAVDPATRTPRAVGSWIRLERSELTLPPHGSVVVPFTVTRPRGSTAEGIGAVVAEELLDSSAGGGISVLYRLAILVRLGGDVAGLEVGVPTLDVPVRLFPSTAELAVDLTNETLQPAQVTVAFTATGVTGRVWPVAEEELRLEPGQSREIAVPWDTVPRSGGMYRPAVSVTWDGGSLVRSGAATPYPPLWLVALAIAAVGRRGVRELRARTTSPDPQARQEPVGTAGAGVS